MLNGSGAINRRKVRVDLKDVYGNTITDEVELTFYNQRVQSLNQRFGVQFQGQAVFLQDVPAFPFGLAEVFIKPTKYRYKSIFADIPAGDGAVDLFAPTDRADYTFFVDPQHASPLFPDLNQLQTRWPDLWAILQNPNASSAAGWWTVNWWNDLNNNQQKAGLLNLYAKMKDYEIRKWLNRAQLRPGDLERFPGEVVCYGTEQSAQFRYDFNSAVPLCPGHAPYISSRMASRR